MIGFVDRVARGLGRDPVPSPVPLPPDVALRTSRLVPLVGGLLSGMGRPAAAVTLGRTILVHPDCRPTPRLLRHELAHVAQWKGAPVTFPIRYIWAHIRHGYRGNPYERAARSAESAGEGGADAGGAS